MEMIATAIATLFKLDMNGNNDNKKVILIMQIITAKKIL